MPALLGVPDTRLSPLSHGTAAAAFIDSFGPGRGWALNPDRLPAVSVQGDSAEPGKATEGSRGWYKKDGVTTL